MDLFKIYTPENAPAPANDILGNLKKMIGFVPNVFAIMGGTHSALKSFVELTTQFGETSLTATEREIVHIAASVENECAYCVAGHTAFAKMQKVPNEVIDAVRNRGVIADPKLAALHDFVRAVVVKRGHLDTLEKERFLAAGYSKNQMQEVILGICEKMFSNLTSIVLDLPLDDAFREYEWTPAAKPPTRAAA